MLPSRGRCGQQARNDVGSGSDQDGLNPKKKEEEEEEEEEEEACVETECPGGASVYHPSIHLIDFLRAVARTWLDGRATAPVI